MKHLIWIVFTLAGISSGCTHIMSEAGLATVDHSITYANIKNNPEALVGKCVMLGGFIAENNNSSDVMQLEVVQLELLDNGVPDELSPSAGRFLAVSGELLDPLFYRPGRFVTIIGEIKGQRVQKLGSVDYRYPLLSAKEIRLFRAADSSLGRPANPYQNQFGDSRFMLRPPGGTAEEPRKP